jgi:vitamin-K-epoxide reductase (warfarin-sensitive)
MRSESIRKATSISGNDNVNYKSTYTKSLKRYELIMSSLNCVGILLSLYAFQVEIHKENDKSYTAYCDIGPFSCTKVFTSKLVLIIFRYVKMGINKLCYFLRYGKGFGLIPKDSVFNLPNSIYGLIYFAIQLLLLIFRNNSRVLQFKLLLSVIANIGCVHLAGILYFILHDFCIVCFMVYVVNAFLLFYNYKHYQLFKSLNSEINKKK